MSDAAHAYLQDVEGGVIIKIWAQPKSSKQKFDGIHDGRLKVRLKSPPVDGKANKELIKLFSKKLSVPQSLIEISTGQSGRRKDILIQGKKGADVLPKLTD